MSNNVQPDHVQVNVTVEDTGSPRDGYGLLGALSHTAPFPDRTRAYGSEAEADDDFPDAGSPERRWLRGVFAQNPKPTSALILRGTLSNTLRYELGAADAKVGAKYAVDVRGQGFDDLTVSYTAAAGASLASVNGAILALLNAIASKNFTVAYATLTGVGPFTFTADAASDQLTHATHGLSTGDGAVRLTTTTTLPAGLALATDYYAIVVDANTFKLANSLANALAGTAINITDAGTGVHTLTATGGAVTPAASMLATGNTPNTWFSLEPASIARFNVAVTSAAPAGLSDELDEIKDEDDSWYMLQVLYPSKAYLVGAADWMETNDREFSFDTPDTDVIKTTYDEGVTDDVGSSMLDDGQYKRTMGTFHAKPSQFATGRVMGVWLGSLPGKENIKFKAPSGVSASKLTTQQKKNLEDRRMNSFQNFAGGVRFSDGSVFSTTNKWIDVTRNSDWLRDEIAVDIVDVNIGDNPYTPEGVQKVGGALHQAFGAAIAQGVSAQSLPNSVVTPNFDDITDEDHANRVLRNVTGSIEFAGFINKVIVDVTIKI